jgi:hypothetical protein
VVIWLKFHQVCMDCHFSTEVGSHHDVSTRAMPGGSPSISTGDLWPNIDKLGKANHEGTSTVVA